MKAIPSITEAESEVLAVLWRDGPLSSKALIEAVRARQPWGDATIKTLLNRLMRKDAVRSDRTREVLVYRPLLSRNDYIDSQVRTLVDRLFEGDVRALSDWLARAA